MGREIRRVALDFDWPLNKVWHGFLCPDDLHEESCQTCNATGYSPHAKHLHDVWYGNAPFRPESNGSTPLEPTTPAVRAFAERNVRNAPQFYGTSEWAIQKEAGRLATMWNGQWSHHLNEADVAALVEADRLWDLTHDWAPGDGWKPKDPPVAPSPAEVNAWAIGSFGHDAINAGVCVQARCERDGAPYLCADCEGRGSHEKYPGQRAEADAWEPTAPPQGEGWQLWETTSEGSPISPVFPDAEGLIQWMTTPAAKHGAAGPWTEEQARAFVTGPGWAPTFMSTAATGLVDGVTGMTS